MLKSRQSLSPIATKKPLQEEVKLTASDFIVDLTDMDANHDFAKDIAEDDNKVSLLLQVKK